MVAMRDRLELDLAVTGRQGLLLGLLADGQGHQRVGGAMDEQLPYAQGHEGARRGRRVAGGDLRGRSPQELCGAGTAGGVRHGLREVQDASQGHDGGQRERIRAPKRMAQGQSPPRGRPDTQVPTGGMAHCEDLAQIERALVCQVTDGVDGAAHIREGLGDSPLLDPPDAGMRCSRSPGQRPSARH